MTLVRAAVFAAALTLVAASHAEAQSSTMRVTLVGGENAGAYEVKDDDCRLLNGEIMALFTPPGEAGSSEPVASSFYTIAGKGKPDGLGAQMIFLVGQYNRQVKYEIHAMPPGVKNPHFFPNSGRGSVTVKKTATGQMATFRGQTRDGVRMEGTLDCRTP